MSTTCDTLWDGQLFMSPAVNFKNCINVIIDYILVLMDPGIVIVELRVVVLHDILIVFLLQILCRGWF